MAKKSWSEKLASNKEPLRKELEKDFADMKAGEMMYIATPQIIKAYIDEIPFGKFIDAKLIRKDLAAANEADVTCPVTTGIFLRIVAEATLEDLQRGAKVEDVSPFWRAIPEGSALAKKLSCGVAYLSELRAAETNN